MAKKHLEVDVRGLPGLRARLQPDRFFAPTKDFIEDLGKTGQRTAQRAAKPHPADKGTLGRAVKLHFEEGGKVAVVDIDSSVAGVAYTIEEGRRPGRRPPYGPIKRWALAHGIIPAGRGGSAKVQELREDIKARGTKGLHFMETAREVTQDALRTGIPRTEREIKAAWDRPHPGDTLIG